VQLRCACLAAVGNLGVSAKPSVSTITEAVKDPDPLIRRVATESLVKIGLQGGALPGLLLALQDEYKEVSDIAFRALKKVERFSPTEVATLIETVKKTKGGARACAISCSNRTG